MSPAWYEPVVEAHEGEIEKQGVDISVEWEYNEKRDRVEFICPETEEGWWVAKATFPFDRLEELVQRRIANAQDSFDRGWVGGFPGKENM